MYENKILECTSKMCRQDLQFRIPAGDARAHEIRHASDVTVGKKNNTKLLDCAGTRAGRENYYSVP